MNVNTIIYTTDLETNPYIVSLKKEGKKCICSLDARSAVYMATGISAQNNECVMVVMDSGNISRSAFAGMTEAFYRKLPVVLVTLGKRLDYSVELKDVVVRHYIESEFSKIWDYIDGVNPIHIELEGVNIDITSICCKELQMKLAEILDKDNYLYISSSIKKENVFFNCKVVHGGMYNCSDGAVANVLGASLAKNHKKYLGLITEDEFIHDISSVGNINVNDLLGYIVIGKKYNKIINDYSCDMGFDFNLISYNKIGELKRILNYDKKLIVFVDMEENE